MARAQAKQTQLLFPGGRSLSTGGYHHLEIRGVQEGVWRDRICEFGWQADRNTDYWYGFHVELRCETGDHLQRACRIAQRVMRDLHSPHPEVVFERLQRMHARHSVYDTRVSQYVPVGEVLPPDIRRWVDDYQTLCHNSCNASVLAVSRDEAQQEIAKQLCDRDEALLREFLDAGRPVMIAYGDTPPEIPDLGDMLRLEWAQPREPEAIAA